MKEKIRPFVADKRGVSPVIGVVLMVAVVVILAAVIGAFVLGLGGDQQAAHQASFSYDSGTLTMESGDAFGAQAAYVKTSGGTNKTVPDGTSVGDTISVTASDGETIRVIDGKADSTIWKATV